MIDSNEDFGELNPAADASEQHPSITDFRLRGGTLRKFNENFMQEMIKTIQRMVSAETFRFDEGGFEELVAEKRWFVEKSTGSICEFTTRLYTKDTGRTIFTYEPDPELYEPKADTVVSTDLMVDDSPSNAPDERVDGAPSEDIETMRKYVMGVVSSKYNIHDIHRYIVANYPNSVVASNLKDASVLDDNDPFLIEQIVDFFYYEKLNWCGCGNPEEAKAAVRDFLEIHEYRASHTETDTEYSTAWDAAETYMKERFGAESVYDDRLLLCFAYAMDAAGLTEHGSSIGGAWLTREGEMFLRALYVDPSLGEEDADDE